MIILVERTLRPIRIRAGGFFSLNLTTFLSARKTVVLGIPLSFKHVFFFQIIRTAYSLFALLNNMQ